MDWKSTFRFNFSFRNSSLRSLNKGERMTSADEESEGDLSPSVVPSREVLPTEAIGSNTTPETITLHRGLTLLKGRVSSSEFPHLGCCHSDLIPGKYEGGLKLWECTIDLIETLRQELQDGRLSFRGKDVLELGCGHGLPGILACIKGARSVHFQDFNVDVLRTLTIPNVERNLEHAKIQAPRPSDGLVRPTPTRKPEVRYFAGDWSEVGRLLSVREPETDCASPASATVMEEKMGEQMGLTTGNGETFCRDDVAEASSSRNRGGLPQEPGDRVVACHPLEGNTENVSLGCQSGSVTERSPDSHVQFDSTSNKNEGDYDCPTATPVPEKQGSSGYDVILMSETVYSPASMPKLYALLKKCLKLPYGVVYVAGKKHYFGVGGGVRQFKTLVEEDGLLTGHLIAEFVDGISNVREIWKFFQSKR